MSELERPFSLRFRLDPSRLGAMLRTIRQAAGLTQAEVAEKLDTQQSAVARMEAYMGGHISLRRFAEFSLACGYAPLWAEGYTPPPTYVSSSALTSQPARPTTAANYKTLPPMAS